MLSLEKVQRLSRKRVPLKRVGKRTATIDAFVKLSMVDDIVWPIWKHIESLRNR
jgi:hypothetical protein